MRVRSGRNNQVGSLDQASGGSGNVTLSLDPEVFSADQTLGFQPRVGQTLLQGRGSGHVPIAVIEPTRRRKFRPPDPRPRLRPNTQRQRAASSAATAIASLTIAPVKPRQGPQRRFRPAPGPCPTRRSGPEAAKSPHPGVPPSTKPLPETAPETYIPHRAHGTKNNGLYQPAHAGASAAVQFNQIYPAPDRSNRSFEYRAAPDKRSSLAPMHAHE